MPSLPMAVTPAILPTWSSSIKRTIVWQPIPAPIKESSGTFVLELCGQPEQKYGLLVALNGMSSR